MLLENKVKENSTTDTNCANNWRAKSSYCGSYVKHYPVDDSMTGSPSNREHVAAVKARLNSYKHKELTPEELQEKLILAAQRKQARIEKARQERADRRLVKEIKAQEQEQLIKKRQDLEMCLQQLKDLTKVYGEDKLQNGFLECVASLT
jgi:hypothetical protein